MKYAFPIAASVVPGSGAVSKLRFVLIATAAIVFSPSLALSQTNAANTSAVGSWKLDLAKSDFGSTSKPKSMTLTILKDTDQASAWRVEGTDEKGAPISYS